MIPFNKPYISGNEAEYITTAFQKGKFSGNGFFTKKCHSFFEKEYGFGKCFLTNSATNALEMAAVLCDIKPGDEVIIPSYTFVSTATPFALLGAEIVFCDNQGDSPNIDVQQIESLISPQTKALVVVHYAGLACDMNAIMEIASNHNILVIEDAAHSITAQYNDAYLGTIGHMAAFSFHETKNVSCGQGGMLVVNDTEMFERAEKVWAKGTNRIDMERGKTDKYTWVDHGSNFYPSEITAAMLYAQLDQISLIQRKRKKIWDQYYTGLASLEELGIQLPTLAPYQSNNYHIFFFLANSASERDALLEYLHASQILGLFHYLPLHRSPFIKKKQPSEKAFPNADKYADRTIRLPLFADLSTDDAHRVIDAVKSFYKANQV